MSFCGHLGVCHRLDSGSPAWPDSDVLWWISAEQIWARCGCCCCCIWQNIYLFIYFFFYLFIYPFIGYWLIDWLFVCFIVCCLLFRWMAAKAIYTRWIRACYVQYSGWVSHSASVSGIKRHVLGMIVRTNNPWEIHTSSDLPISSPELHWSWDKK